MPYINIENRSKFKTSIEIILNLVTTGTDSAYIRGEFFGYFVNRIVRRLSGASDYAGNFFNSAFFNEEKKKKLADHADKVSTILHGMDPLDAAGELNYCVSALYWGVLGAAEGVPDARYGIRAYLVGILEKILETTQSVNSGSQRDVTMAFRRHLILRGVVHDILDETYRRQTGYYEDEKRLDNKDIWHLGQLVVPEEKDE